MKRFTAVILISFFLFSCTAPAQNNTEEAQTTETQMASESKAAEEAIAPWHDLFYYVRPQLELNEVPLRLPSYVPPGNKEIGKEGWVAQLVKGLPEKSHYKIVIAEPNCGDVTACKYATIEGFKIHQNTPALSEQLEERKSPDLDFSESAPFPPSKVELAQGVQGYLFPWFVGAYLTESQVAWEEGDYRYSVGAKGASKAEIIKMANSAIENPDGRVPNQDQ